ncbi:MAG: c-type cytochrome [Gammaproteobacteria bacterium]|nr:c-type cytochrome [Gammaproteobacteria bacterium]
MTTIKCNYRIVLVTILFILSGVAWGADAPVLLSQKGCSNCHDLNGPPAATIAEVLKRKAPDLFYAGSKFQEQWLVDYLQHPIQLRPAGTVYLNHIKTNTKGQDEVSEVPGCESRLTQEEAVAVAQHLMTLKDANMETGVVTLGKFSKARARKVFSKDEGCNGCHRIQLRARVITGGVSCPDLFNAGDRLNPDWVFSVIKDPQYWDPKAWMPVRNLDDATVLLLTQFLMSQKEKPENQK